MFFNDDDCYVFSLDYYYFHVYVAPSFSVLYQLLLHLKSILRNNLLLDEHNVELDYNDKECVVVTIKFHRLI